MYEMGVVENEEAIRVVGDLDVAEPRLGRDGRGADQRWMASDGSLKIAEGVIGRVEAVRRGRKEQRRGRIVLEECRAPTRRESAASACWSASLVCRNATAPAAAAPTSRSTSATTRTRSRRLVRTWRRASSSAARCSASASCTLASRNACSSSDSSTEVRSRHSIAWASRIAAVQLAVGPAERLPGLGRDAEVVEDPLALDVLLEPVRAAAARPGPAPRGPAARLSSSLVTSRAPTSSSIERSWSASAASSPRGTRAAERFTLRAGDDEPQQRGHAAASAARPATRVVDLLGRLGDRAADAARLAVARRRSACGPRGAPMSRRARATATATRRARPRRHGPEVDEPRLEQQPGLVRRSLDGRAQAVLAAARRGGSSPAR